MLQACVLEIQGNWVLHLVSIEFTYNNSYQASIGMAPYEALYRRICWNPLYQDEVGERKLENVELIEAISKKIKIIKDKLKVAEDRQKNYADTWKRVLEFEVGDTVFLMVAPWKCLIRSQK